MVQWQGDVVILWFYRVAATTVTYSTRAANAKHRKHHHLEKLRMWNAGIIAILLIWKSYMQLNRIQGIVADAFVVDSHQIVSSDCLPYTEQVSNFYVGFWCQWCSKENLTNTLEANIPIFDITSRTSLSTYFFPSKWPMHSAISKHHI